MRHRFIALLVLFTVIFFSSAEAQTTARKFEAGKNTLKSASNLNGNLNGSKELEHYAS